MAEKGFSLHFVVAIVISLDYSLRAVRNFLG
jgi:hypothetical protein